MKQTDNGLFGALSFLKDKATDVLSDVADKKEVQPVETQPIQTQPLPKKEEKNFYEVGKSIFSNTYDAVSNSDFFSDLEKQKDAFLSTTDTIYENGKNMFDTISNSDFFSEIKRQSEKQLEIYSNPSFFKGKERKEDTVRDLFKTSKKKAASNDGNFFTRDIPNAFDDAVLGLTDARNFFRNMDPFQSEEVKQASRDYVTEAREKNEKARAEFQKDLEVKRSLKPVFAGNSTKKYYDYINNEIGLDTNSIKGSFLDGIGRGIGKTITDIERTFGDSETSIAPEKSEFFKGNFLQNQFDINSGIKFGNANDNNNLIQDLDSYSSSLTNQLYNKKVDISKLMKAESLLSEKRRLDNLYEGGDKNIRKMADVVMGLQEEFNTMKISEGKEKEVIDIVDYDDVVKEYGEEKANSYFKGIFDSHRKSISDSFTDEEQSYISMLDDTANIDLKNSSDSNTYRDVLNTINKVDKAKEYVIQGEFGMSVEDFEKKVKKFQEAKEDSHDAIFIQQYRYTKEGQDLLKRLDVIESPVDRETLINIAAQNEFNVLKMSEEYENFDSGNGSEYIKKLEQYRSDQNKILDFKLKIAQETQSLRDSGKYSFESDKDLKNIAIKSLYGTSDWTDTAQAQRRIENYNLEYKYDLATNDKSAMMVYKGISAMWANVEKGISDGYSSTVSGISDELEGKKLTELGVQDKGYSYQEYRDSMVMDGLLNDIENNYEGLGVNIKEGLADNSESVVGVGLSFLVDPLKFTKGGNAANSFSKLGRLSRITNKAESLKSKIEKGRSSGKDVSELVAKLSKLERTIESVKTTVATEKAALEATEIAKDAKDAKKLSDTIKKKKGTLGTYDDLLATSKLANAADKGTRFILDSIYQGARMDGAIEQAIGFTPDSGTQAENLIINTVTDSLIGGALVSPLMRLKRTGYTGGEILQKMQKGDKDINLELDILRKSIYDKQVEKGIKTPKLPSKAQALGFFETANKAILNKRLSNLDGQSFDDFNQVISDFITSGDITVTGSKISDSGLIITSPLFKGLSDDSKRLDIFNDAYLRSIKTGDKKLESTYKDIIVNELNVLKSAIKGDNKSYKSLTKGKQANYFGSSLKQIRDFGVNGLGDSLTKSELVKEIDFTIKSLSKTSKSNAKKISDTFEKVKNAVAENVDEASSTDIFMYDMFTGKKIKVDLGYIIRYTKAKKLANSVDKEGNILQDLKDIKNNITNEDLKDLLRETGGKVDIRDDLVYYDHIDNNNKVVRYWGLSEKDLERVLINQGIEITGGFRHSDRLGITDKFSKQREEAIKINSSSKQGAGKNFVVTTEAPKFSMDIMNSVNSSFRSVDNELYYINKVSKMNNDIMSIFKTHKVGNLEKSQFIDPEDFIKNIEVSAYKILDRNDIVNSIDLKRGHPGIFTHINRSSLTKEKKTLVIKKVMELIARNNEDYIIKHIRSQYGESVISDTVIDIGYGLQSQSVILEKAAQQDTFFTLAKGSIKNPDDVTNNVNDYYNFVFYILPGKRLQQKEKFIDIKMKYSIAGSKKTKQALEEYRKEVSNVFHLMKNMEIQNVEDYSKFLNIVLNDVKFYPSEFIKEYFTEFEQKEVNDVFDYLRKNILKGIDDNIRQTIYKNFLYNYAANKEEVIKFVQKSKSTDKHFDIVQKVFLSMTAQNGLVFELKNKGIKEFYNKTNARNKSILDLIKKDYDSYAHQYKTKIAIEENNIIFYKRARKTLQKEYKDRIKDTSSVDLLSTEYKSKLDFLNKKIKDSSKFINKIESNKLDYDSFVELQLNSMIYSEVRNKVVDSINMIANKVLNKEKSDFLISAFNIPTSKLSSKNIYRIQKVLKNKKLSDVNQEIHKYFLMQKGYKENINNIVSKISKNPKYSKTFSEDIFENIKKLKLVISKVSQGLKEELKLKSINKDLNLIYTIKNNNEKELGDNVSSIFQNQSIIETKKKNIKKIKAFIKEINKDIKSLEKSLEIVSKKQDLEKAKSIISDNIYTDNISLGQVYNKILTAFDNVNKDSIIKIDIDSGDISVNDNTINLSTLDKDDISFITKQLSLLEKAKRGFDIKFFEDIDIGTEKINKIKDVNNISFYSDEIEEKTYEMVTKPIFYNISSNQFQTIIGKNFRRIFGISEKQVLDKSFLIKEINTKGTKLHDFVESLYMSGNKNKEQIIEEANVAFSKGQDLIKQLLKDGNNNINFKAIDEYREKDFDITNFDTARFINRLKTFKNSDSDSKIALSINSEGDLVTSLNNGEELPILYKQISNGTLAGNIDYISGYKKSTFNKIISLLKVNASELDGKDKYGLLLNFINKTESKEDGVYKLMDFMNTGIIKKFKGDTKKLNNYQDKLRLAVRKKLGLKEGEIFVGSFGDKDGKAMKYSFDGITDPKALDFIHSFDYMFTGGFYNTKNGKKSWEAFVDYIKSNNIKTYAELEKAALEFEYGGYGLINYLQKDKGLKKDLSKGGWEGLSGAIKATRKREASLTSVKSIFDNLENKVTFYHVKPVIDNDLDNIFKDITKNHKRIKYNSIKKYQSENGITFDFDNKKGEEFLSNIDKIVKDKNYQDKDFKAFVQKLNYSEALEKVEKFKEYADNRLGPDGELSPIVYNGYVDEINPEETVDIIKAMFLDDFEDGTEHGTKDISDIYAAMNGKDYSSGFKSHIAGNSKEGEVFLGKGYINTESNLYFDNGDLLSSSVLVGDNSLKKTGGFVTLEKEEKLFINKIVNGAERKYEVISIQEGSLQNFRDAGSESVREKSIVSISSIIEGHNYKFSEEMRNIITSDIENYINDFLSKFSDTKNVGTSYGLINRLIMNLVKGDRVDKFKYLFSDQFYNIKFDELVGRIKSQIEKPKTNGASFKSYMVDPYLHPDEVVINPESKMGKTLMKDFNLSEKQIIKNTSGGKTLYEFKDGNPYLVTTRYPVSDKYVSGVYKVKFSTDISKKQIITHPENAYFKLKSDHDGDTIVTYSAKDTMGSLLAKAIYHTSGRFSDADKLIALDNNSFIKLLDSDFYSDIRINKFVVAEEVDKDSVEVSKITLSQSRASASTGKQTIEVVAGTVRSIDIFKNSLQSLFDAKDIPSTFNSMPPIIKDIVAYSIYGKNFKPIDKFYNMLTNNISAKGKDGINAIHLERTINSIDMPLSLKQDILDLDLNDKIKKLFEVYKSDSQFMDYPSEKFTHQTYKNSIDKFMNYISIKYPDIDFYDMFFKDLNLSKEQLVYGNNKIQNILSGITSDNYIKRSAKYVNLAVDFGNSGKKEFDPDWLEQLMSAMNIDSSDFETFKEKISAVTFGYGGKVNYDSNFANKTINLYSGNKYFLSKSTLDSIQGYRDIKKSSAKLPFLMEQFTGGDSKLLKALGDVLYISDGFSNNLSYSRSEVPSVNKYLKEALGKKRVSNMALPIVTSYMSPEQKFAVMDLLLNGRVAYDTGKTLPSSFKSPGLFRKDRMNEVVSHYNKQGKMYIDFLKDNSVELKEMKLLTPIRSDVYELISMAKKMRSGDISNADEDSIMKILSNFDSFAKKNSDNSRVMGAMGILIETLGVDELKLLRKYNSGKPFVLFDYISDSLLSSYIRNTSKTKFNVLSSSSISNGQLFLQKQSNAFNALFDSGKKELVDFLITREKEINNLLKNNKSEKINSLKIKEESNQLNLFSYIKEKENSIDDINQKIKLKIGNKQKQKKALRKLKTEIEELRNGIEISKGIITDIDSYKYLLNERQEIVNNLGEILDVSSSDLVSDIKNMPIEDFQNKYMIDVSKENKRALKTKINSIKKRIKANDEKIEKLSFVEKDFEINENKLEELQKELGSIQDYIKNISLKEESYKTFNDSVTSYIQSMKVDFEKNFSNSSSLFQIDYNKDLSDIYGTWNKRISNEVYNDIKGLSDKYNKVYTTQYVEEIKNKDPEFIDTISGYSYIYNTDYEYMLKQRTSWNKISEEVKNVLTQKTSKSYFGFIRDFIYDSSKYKTSTTKFVHFQEEILGLIKKSILSGIVGDSGVYKFDRKNFDKTFVFLVKREFDTKIGERIGPQTLKEFKEAYPFLSIDEYTLGHAILMKLNNSEFFKNAFDNYEFETITKSVDLLNKVDSYFGESKNIVSKYKKETTSSIIEDIVGAMQGDNNMALVDLGIHEENKFKIRFEGNGFSSRQSTILYSHLVKKEDFADQHFWDFLNNLSYMLKYGLGNVIHWSGTVAGLQQGPGQLTEILGSKASYGIEDRELYKVLSVYGLVTNEDTHIFANSIGLQNANTFASKNVQSVIDYGLLSNNGIVKNLAMRTRGMTDFVVNPLGKSDAVFDNQRRLASIARAMHLSGYKTYEDVVLAIDTYGQKELVRLQSEANMFYNELGGGVSSKNSIYKLNKVFTTNSYNKKSRNILGFLGRAWESIGGYLNAWAINKADRIFVTPQKLFIAASNGDRKALSIISKQMEARFRNFMYLYLMGVKFEKYQDPRYRSNPVEFAKMLFNDYVGFISIASPFIRTYEMARARDYGLDESMVVFGYNLLDRYINSPTVIGKILGETSLQYNNHNWDLDPESSVKDNGYKVMMNLIDSFVGAINDMGGVGYRYNGIVNNNDNVGAGTGLSATSLLSYGLTDETSLKESEAWELSSQSTINRRLFGDKPIGEKSVEVLGRLFGFKDFQGNESTKHAKILNEYVDNDPLLDSISKGEVSFEKIYSVYMENPDYYKDGIINEETKIQQQANFVNFFSDYFGENGKDWYSNTDGSNVFNQSDFEAKRDLLKKENYEKYYKEFIVQKTSPESKEKFYDFNSFLYKRMLEDGSQLSVPEMNGYLFYNRTMDHLLDMYNKDYNSTNKPVKYVPSNFKNSGFFKQQAQLLAIKDMGDFVYTDHGLQKEMQRFMLANNDIVQKEIYKNTGNFLQLNYYEKSSNVKDSVKKQKGSLLKVQTKNKYPSSSKTRQNIGYQIISDIIDLQEYQNLAKESETGKISGFLKQFTYGDYLTKKSIIEDLGLSKEEIKDLVFQYSTIASGKEFEEALSHPDIKKSMVDTGGIKQSVNYMYKLNKDLQDSVKEDLDKKVTGTSYGYKASRRGYSKKSFNPYPKKSYTGKSGYSGKGRSGGGGYSSGRNPIETFINNNRGLLEKNPTKYLNDNFKPLPYLISKNTYKSQKMLEYRVASLLIPQLKNFSSFISETGKIINNKGSYKKLLKYKQKKMKPLKNISNYKKPKAKKTRVSKGLLRDKSYNLM